jgi:hypothetical protein
MQIIRKLLNLPAALGGILDDHVFFLLLDLKALRAVHYYSARRESQWFVYRSPAYSKAVPAGEESGC